MTNKNVNIENLLIIKYLLHQLTEEESELVSEWIRFNQKNQEFLFGLEELYWANQMEEMQELADTNHEWKKLEAQILKGQKNEDKRHKIYWLTSLFKYAAIIAVAISLPFMIYKMGFFNKNGKENTANFATIVTGKGERSQLILPDGTKIWINSCSSLTYNTDFTSQRKLKLSGEAYFEVNKDEYRPFIVSTSLLEIQVLGTKFNLKAFNNDNEVQTTLYEGSIAANSSNKSFKQDILLKPGDQLTYGKDKTLVIIPVKNNDDMEWRDGIFHFKKKKLQNIVNSLERSFNVEIIISDLKLAQEEFTCEFENNESLVDMLNILKMTNKLDYSIEGSKVKISSNKKLTS